MVLDSNRTNNRCSTPIQGEIAREHLPHALDPIPTTKSAKFLLGLNIAVAILMFLISIFAAISGGTEQLQELQRINSSSFEIIAGTIFGCVLYVAFFVFWLWLDIHAYRKVKALRERAQELSKTG